MPRQKLTVEERKAAGARPKPDAPHERKLAFEEPIKPKLSKEESAIWDQIVPPLVAQRVVCSYDAHILLDYCVLRAEFEKNQNYLRKNGWFIQLDNAGNKKPRAEVKLCSDLEKKLDKLIEKLGLSPKARKAMHIVLAGAGNGGGETREAKASILKRR